MQALHVNDAIQESAVLADETQNLVRDSTTSASEIARVLLASAAQSMGPVRAFAHAMVQNALQSYSIFMAWIANFMKYLAENAAVLYAQASLGQLLYDAWGFAISEVIPSISSIIQPLTARLVRGMHGISDYTSNAWAEESARYHCALLKQAMVEYWQDIRPGAQILLIVHLLVASLIFIVWLDKGRRQGDAVINRIPMMVIPYLGSYLVSISSSMSMGCLLAYLRLYMAGMRYWTVLQNVVEVPTSSVTLWILLVTMKYAADIAYHGLSKYLTLSQPQSRFLHDLYNMFEEARSCLRDLFSRCVWILPAACIIRMIFMSILPFSSFLHLSLFQTSDVDNEIIEVKTAILGELFTRHTDLVVEFAQAYTYILVVLGMYQLELLAWSVLEYLSPLLAFLARDLGDFLYLLAPYHMDKLSGSSLWSGFNSQPVFDALQKFHYNALFQLQVACCYGSATLETSLEDAGRAVSASHELATSVGKTVQTAFSSSTARPVSFGKECARLMNVILMRAHTATVTVVKGVGLLVSVIVLLVVSTAAGIFLIIASIPLLVLQFSRLITWTLVNLTLSVIMQGVGALEYLLADVGGRDGIRFMRYGWQVFGARMIAKELSTMIERIR